MKELDSAGVRSLMREIWDRKLSSLRESTGGANVKDEENKTL